MRVFPCGGREGPFAPLVPFECLRVQGSDALVERTYLCHGGAASMVERIRVCGKHKSRCPLGAADGSTLLNCKTTYGLWPMAYGLWPMACGLWPVGEAHAKQEG